MSASYPVRLVGCDDPGTSDPVRIVNLPDVQEALQSVGTLDAPLIIGASPDYAEFEDDGFLEFHGDARAWVDYNFGVGALSRGASAPDLISLSATSIQTLGFDGVNTLEQVSATLELNHNWAEGTIIKPHVHWYPSTAGAGSVEWFMEYVIVEDGAVVPASTTIAILQAAGGVAWYPKFAAFPDIVTTGVTIGAQMHIRLYRNPTAGNPDDTYGADAALATFGLHVLVNTLGSRQVAIK
jgi:hypothetical protein